MESENDIARKKRSMALMNFLQNHPRHLNSVSKFDRQENGKPPHLPNRDFKKSRMDDFSLELSHIRSRAISILMITHGLKFEEIMELTISDIDLEEKAFAVRHRNGSVTSWLALNNDTVDALSAYLWVRPPTKSDKLFSSCSG